MPIKMYSRVHIGPKIQLGGLKEGLLRVGYQVMTASEVNKPPIAPMERGINKQMTKGINWKRG